MRPGRAHSRACKGGENDCPGPHGWSGADCCRLLTIALVYTCTLALVYILRSFDQTFNHLSHPPWGLHAPRPCVSSTVGVLWGAATRRRAGGREGGQPATDSLCPRLSSALHDPSLHLGSAQPLLFNTPAVYCRPFAILMVIWHTAASPACTGRAIAGRRGSAAWPR